MATSLTLRRRKRSQPQEGSEHPRQQLYRTNGSIAEAMELLEKEPLTDEEIRNFCYSSTTTASSGTSSPVGDVTSDAAAAAGATQTAPSPPLPMERSSLTPHKMNTSCTLDRSMSTRTEQERLAYEERVKLFRSRRIEIQQLLRKVRTGHARFDEDGRLLPVSDADVDNPQPAAPPNIQLAPPPPPPPRNNNNNNNNNNRNNNLDLLANGLLLNEEDNDQHIRQWIQQEQRAAAADIERAVERYRSQGVDDDDLLLVRVHPHMQDQRTNLTFRRICFAALAVVTSIVCIMIQHFPLYSFATKSSRFRNGRSNKDKNQNRVGLPPAVDSLMHELLHVKLLEDHDRHCPYLSRENRLLTSSSWMEQLWGQLLLLGVESFSTFQSKHQDCSDGVLHIPEQSQLMTNSKRINATWFIPCHAPADMDNLPESYPGSSQPPLTLGSNSSTCPDPGQLQAMKGSTQRPSLCFRGVHDDFVSGREIDQALKMGSMLIRNGGDHFDIHHNVDYLQETLPSIVKKLRAFLEQHYHVQVAPVAYRINAAGPMDGRGVPKVLKFDYDYDTSSSFFGGSSSLSQQMVSIVNMTNYVHYMEHAQRRNELSRFSLPWPFRVAPKRDHCMLMADLQANERFAIHTDIFLSSGGGRYFSGGTTLYVDHHASNSNPRRKIRRGLSIDGSRGRLVVSTGGLENKRCRLPIRSKIRADLQIWWA